MSTTDTRPGTQQRADATLTTAEGVAREPTDLYTILIHESPEVCSNCHHQIRDREEHDHSAQTLGTGNRPTETLERAGDGEVGHDVEVKDRYGAIRHYRAQTYCGHCGQPGGRARDDTPSRREMLQAVDPLVARFDDAGVPLNPDKLRFLVDHLHTERGEENVTTEIWRAAVAKAAEYARPRDCVRCSSPPTDR